jgi:hypothetical protein
MMKNLSQTGSSHSPQPSRVGSRRALLAADRRGRVGEAERSERGRGGGWGAEGRSEPSEGSQISHCGLRRASQPSNTSLTAARASTASAAVGRPASGTNATPSGKRTRDSKSGRFSLLLVYPRCRLRARGFWGVRVIAVVDGTYDYEAITRCVLFSRPRRLSLTFSSR